MEADKDSMAGELSVVMRDRGVGVTVEADTGRHTYSRAGDLSVAMRDRGVEAVVEADKPTTGLESYLWSCNRVRGLLWS